MNTKVVIGGIVITLILIFGGLYLVSRPTVTPQVLASSIGKLSTAESFYDFGSVSMAKGVVKHTFALTNSDSVPATVTKLFTSCMCTKADITVNSRKWGPYGMEGMGPAIPNIAAEIAPGQNGQVEVTFDPAAHGPAGIGQIDRQVTVELNGQPPLTLKIHAVVTP